MSGRKTQVEVVYTHTHQETKTKSRGLRCLLQSSSIALHGDAVGGGSAHNSA